MTETKKISEHNEEEDFDAFLPEEAKIIQSIVGLRDVSVETIMIPFNQIYMIDASQKISSTLIYEVFMKGHSKLPVFKGSRNNVIGILPAKKLITGAEYEGKSVEESMPLSDPTYIAKDHNLLELLSIMQKEKISFALVTGKELRTNQAIESQQDIGTGGGSARRSFFGVGTPNSRKS